MNRYFPLRPTYQFVDLMLQYSLNALFMTYGTTPFGQRLEGLITAVLSCSSVITMSPSNLPLCSHALCLSVSSATKLTVTHCVATGCSSCKNYTAVLVGLLYSGLMGFVVWSWVLSFTEAHGRLIN